MFAARMAMDVVAAQSRWSPRNYANLAAWYDVSDASSMIIDGSNRVSLIADKSGNSPVNALCLNASSGNYASFSALTAFGTGAFSVSARIRTSSLATTQGTIGGASSSFSLRVVLTTGKLEATKVGVSAVSQSTGAISALQDVVVGYTRSGTTGTYYINGVASGTVADSTDYSVGVTSIGANGAGGTTNAFVGSIRWARVYSSALTAGEMLADSGGAVQSNCVINADFSVGAKLATSVAATTGQTVTINSSGDLGARISGERDLVQLTASKQPVYTASGTYVTFDGTDDYMKASAFSLSQPESIYFVGRQVSWTLGDCFVDGGSANTLQLVQDPATPGLAVYAGGGASASTSSLPVGTTGIVSGVYDGAASTIRINRLSGATTNIGTGSPNGLILGARGDVANYGNARCSALAIYSAAHTTAQQDSVIVGLGSRFGINTEPLTASVSQSSISVSGANGTVNTGNVTASGVNGIPGYTYSWARISGSAQISATASTSASTAFSATGTDSEYSATFRVTVTDAGGSAATANVDVYISIGTLP